MAVRPNYWFAEAIGLNQLKAQSPWFCSGSARIIERDGDCDFVVRGVSSFVGHLESVAQPRRSGIRRRLSAIGRHLESTDYVGPATRPTADQAAYSLSAVPY